MSCNFGGFNLEKGTHDPHQISCCQVPYCDRTDDFLSDALQW